MNKEARRRLGVITTFILLIVGLTFFFNWSSASIIRQIPYSELVRTIKSGNIESIRISRDGAISGRYKIEVERKFRFQSQINPNDEGKINSMLLELNPVPEIIKGNEAEFPVWDILKMGFLFLLIIFFIRFFWIMMVSPHGFSGSGNVGDFIGKMAKRSYGKKTNTRFKDVAGIDEAKEELKDIVDFLAYPEKYTILGARIPRGVLLIGPSGVGKTLLARATAGEANVPFFSISGSEFVEMFVGVGASRARDLFKNARQCAPCIIFIDEIDSLGSRSSGLMTNSTSEHDQTLNQILTEMDGFESSTGIMVMGATNREDKLDSALLRPGRFDRRIYINLPDINGREQILRIHASHVILDESVDLKILARLTPGFSGADLANLVNESALAAAKAGKKFVSLADFETAKDRILLGKENKSLSSVMTEEEKRVTAVHEAGHAIVALVMPENDPLHKVSIIPRARALGITSQLPEKDRYNYSKEYLFENICILYGGRIAEKLILRTITAGAKNDIERATKIAQTMVCELGMSQLLEPRDYSLKPDKTGHYYDISEATQREVDIAVSHILKEAYRKAREIITEHRQKLEKIANALIEKETLDREEIERIFNE